MIRGPSNIPFGARLPAIAALAAGLVLVGCNQSGRPPGGGGGGPIPSTSVVPAQATSPPVGGAVRNYTILTGDTVYGVAGRFDVPIRTLIEANGLTAPYRLQPGRQLAIPARREHVIQPGETVRSIARIYGVDQSTLIRTNEIPPPYVVRTGDRLRLPAPVEAASTAPTAAQPPPATAPAGSMTVEELEPLAPPADGTADRAQPEEAPQTATAPPPVPQTGPVPLPLPSSPSGTGPETAEPGAAIGPANPEPPPALAPEAGPSASVGPAGPTETIPAAIPQPPPLSSGKFLWPINGRVISAFGPKDGGLHNDGINIAAPRGTPVRAVESGVVAYSGNELRGFGKLLLIRHADGWVSAYAHNDTLLVQRGDQVTRGQTIARVGSSGNVSTPQLHFELRRGTRSVDPLEHLGTQGAVLSPGAAPDDPPDLG